MTLFCPKTLAKGLVVPTRVLAAIIANLATKGFFIPAYIPVNFLSESMAFASSLSKTGANVGNLTCL